MTLDEALSALKAAGSEKTRKMYARHGVTREMFGVSYADLEKLRKAIKTNDALAKQLWRSGNHDARTLAAMVADPAKATVASLSSWVNKLDHSLLAAAVSKLASRTPVARACFEKWRGSKKDHAAAAGWMTLAMLMQNDADLPDAYLERQLRDIENGIRSAGNETRYAMNGALIAIGGRNAKLQKLALAAAARIGTVEVDHGDTGCKTPDAAAYIKKVAARKKARA
jgi:3-methyladenine DNA glycosylase AlkD